MNDNHISYNRVWSESDIEDGLDVSYNSNVDELVQDKGNYKWINMKQ